MRTVTKILTATVMCLWLPAASFGVIETVTVEPASPTADSSFTVTVSGWLTDGCWGASPAPVEVDGSNIKVIVEATDIWQPGLACILIIIPYMYSFEVGPLAPGQYLLTAIESYESARNPFPSQQSLPIVVTGDTTRCLGEVGNVNCDVNQTTDIADLTCLIDHLFISFPPLYCTGEANVNLDAGGVVDIADLTALIDHLFITFQPLPVCAPH